MSVASKNARQIFLAAVKLASDQRESYLVEACAGDEELRQRVAALIKSHEEIGSFLEAPLAVTDANDTPRSPPQFSEGTQIGPYKLLQQIGEGGMGVVYMAEQQKPVRRRVALKIIKPGMDSRQVIARFEAERQALAMMDHPNIARVLDASCTESGRPYFVMELIQGIPVTAYCDDKQLNTSERLELFIQVCHAVQHAHQKGIIHRDIKPSNVLVMIYDGKPIPKIIDFGVAKALHQQLTEKTMFTQFGAVVGTLEYMSPEQAEMDVMGTDTRTDVYSLGVLLYELLTGSTPLDGKKLRALGYAEMLKTIREVDPPKPSTRLSQSAHDVANISAKRHTEPRRLQKLIAGDLDWIVMKCLEKDRTRRYETANGLAMDIQRHLHDEAVTASPPGQFYKLQKLVRRNKLACTAVGCVTLALVLGLVASLWQAGRAEREAARAQNEAARAQQEADRASEALKDLQAAAPSIAAEAHALAAQEKFDEAIVKLEYAAKLRPEVPDYLCAKGDLLESQFRLADAAVAYRAALKLKPDDARAKANAELCDQLAAAGADGQLTRESLSKLFAQMVKDQRPAAQLMPVARILGDEKKLIVNYWLDRLKDLPNGTDTPLEKRLTVRDDGRLALDLSDTKVIDLSPLAGAPLAALDVSKSKDLTDLSPLRGLDLVELNISKTNVEDLTPLREMHTLEKLEMSDSKVSDLAALSTLRMKSLNFKGCPVSDLNPIRKMPLEEINLRETRVADLTPLVGMSIRSLDLTQAPVLDFSPLSQLPLEKCYLQRNRITDLAVLRGRPLKELVLWGCEEARNYAVLKEFKSLELLLLPSEYRALPADDYAAIGALRSHPRLRQLGSEIMNGMGYAATGSKDAFWQDWDREQSFVPALRASGFEFSLRKLPAGTYELVVGDQPLRDLSILKGAPISSLSLYSSTISDLTPIHDLKLEVFLFTGNSVADLGPLRGMPLKKLYLAGAKISDLSPLKGLPLRELYVENCPSVTDVADLAEIPTLEMVTVPMQARNIETLRNLAALKMLAFNRAGGSLLPTSTAAEFWKEFDANSWMTALRNAGIKFNATRIDNATAQVPAAKGKEAVTRPAGNPAGLWNVTITSPDFSDCSLFERADNIRELRLDGTAVSDLQPLRGMALTKLNVEATKVADLSPLQGMPLEELGLWKTKVADLSPLRGMRLKYIQVSVTNVTDLEPLRGMPITVIRMYSTAVSDLTPLTGMRLERLDVGKTKVADISCLRGMPLIEAKFGDCDAITDLSPLAEAKELTTITLPPNATSIEFLRAFPKLDRISFREDSRNQYRPDKAAAEFWNEFGQTWMTALRKAGMKYTASQDAAGKWSVAVTSAEFRDCSIFKGAPIRELILKNTHVTDLTPLGELALSNLDLRSTSVSDLSALRAPTLSGSLKELYLWKTQVTDFSPVAACMKLEVLDASNCPLEDLSIVRGRSLRIIHLAGTKVTDISILAGMPLTRAVLKETAVTDLSPLLQCPTLRELAIPAGAHDIESLRALPALKALSYTTPAGGVPTQSVADFWKEFDAKKEGAVPAN